MYWFRLFYVYGPGQRPGAIIPTLVKNYNGIVYDYIITLTCEKDGIWKGFYEFHRLNKNGKDIINDITVKEHEEKITITGTWIEDNWEYQMKLLANITKVDEFDDNDWMIKNY